MSANTTGRELLRWVIQNKRGQKLPTTTGGAIGISAIGSFIGLCCIGPWAIDLFGVSEPMSPPSRVVA